MNFIDLGLESGTKWLDCYNSGLIWTTDFDLLTETQFSFYKNHIPTIDQFKELHSFCKIKKYFKGCYNLLLITGPNGNRIRLFESVWNCKRTQAYGKDFNLMLLNYWVNGDFFTRIGPPFTKNVNTPNKFYNPEVIPAYSLISTNLIIYAAKSANLIFVDV